MSSYLHEAISTKKKSVKIGQNNDLLFAKKIGPVRLYSTFQDGIKHLIVKKKLRGDRLRGDSFFGGSTPEPHL